MIKFEALAMNIHAIFLLNKNVKSNITKKNEILGYLLIIVLESLKEWKVVITLVRQKYKYTKWTQDHGTELGIIYRGKGLPMDIGKAEDNYNKERKSWCFNCNIYRHMVKDCRKPKKRKRN